MKSKTQSRSRFSALSAGTLLAATAAIAFAAPPTIVPYQVQNYAISESLTGVPGDPVNGLAVIVHRQKGNCLGCHHVPIDEQFFGTTGPSLAGVGQRLNEGQLRLRLVDSKQVNPVTMMPSYYRIDGLHRVLHGFEGKPILSAQEVEDVVAFLLTLKQGQ